MLCWNMQFIWYYVITNKGRQMDRWVEHYSELYSRDNTVAASALDAIEPLPIMEELDAEPTYIAELCKAIGSLASGKAPGNDGIPPDLIKCCKDMSLTAAPSWCKLAVLERGSAIPQDMRDMPRLSPCTRVKVKGVIVTNTDLEASRFWISLGNSTPASCLCVSRNLLCMSTRNLSVASEQNALQWTWYFPPSTSGKMQRTTQAPLHSLHRPDLRPLTWSAGKGCSTSSLRSAALQNSTASSDPFMMTWRQWSSMRAARPPPLTSKVESSKAVYWLQASSASSLLCS